VAAQERLKAAFPSGAPTPADVLRVQRIFVTLQPGDADLIRLMAFPKDDELAAALATCSAANASPQHIIGVLTWYFGVIRPAILKRVPLFLKKMYDDDLLEETAIREWHAASAKASAEFLPDGATLAEEVIVGIKENANQFITWLTEAADEEEDDEDEDD